MRASHLQQLAESNFDSRLSVETKSDFNADLDVHRMTIFLRRLETPLFDGFNRFGVEAKSKAAHYANISWISVVIDNQPENAGSLSLGVARFFGVFRIRRRNCLGRRYSSAHLIYASTDAATASYAYSGAVADTYAATGAGADTSA
jgi:hypothetical protein